MLIQTAILRSIILWFTISCFTMSWLMVHSIKPLYASVVDGSGGLTGGAEHVKPVSQWMDVEVTVELESNSLNEEGKIEPGSRILYLISIFNGSSMTIFDALLVAKVPQSTLFIFENSDARWSAALLMDRYRKSPERSCPDRQPPGIECSIELGNLGPDERIATIRYAVEVDGEIAMSVETIDLNIELLGSLTDNGPLDVREKTINNTMLASPTALSVTSEPVIIFDAKKDENDGDLQRPELDLPIPPRRYYIYIPWIVAQ